MKLIALLLGLFLEKISTSLFGLREMRWLDRYFDRGLRILNRCNRWQGYLVALVVIGLLVLPIAAISLTLASSTRDILYLIVSVVVLFVSLGPRDLNAEVTEFAQATRAGDEETSHRVAKELLEFDPPEDPAQMGASVASAVFVQSNNRTFGVVLWFVLFGPIGAWVFRVSDLLRRRAFFENGRLFPDASEVARFLEPIQSIHGVLAWLPSRLTAMSFALAGSFEPATTAWKTYYKSCSEKFFEVNDDIVAHAGCGALGASIRAGMKDVPESGATGAMSLVQRSMIVWLVVIALLTIAGAAI